MRQSTTLRKTEVSSGREQKSSSIVSTNMLHLYRFAKHLGREQKLEVLKEDKPASNENEESELSASGMFGESVKEDVQVKDFLPVLKQICDKLEEADNNVRFYYLLHIFRIFLNINVLILLFLFF